MPKKKKEKKEKLKCQIVQFETIDGLKGCDHAELSHPPPKFIWREVGTGRVFTREQIKVAREKPAALRPYEFTGENSLALFYTEYWNHPECVKK